MEALFEFTLKGRITSLKFSNYNNNLYAFSNNEIGYYYSKRNKNQVKKELQRINKDSITTVAFLNNGSGFYTGNNLGLLNLYDNQFNTIFNNKKLSPINHITLTPESIDENDELLLIFCQDKTISIHNFELTQLKLEKKLNYEVYETAWFEDGSKFLAVGFSNDIGLFSRDGTFLFNILRLTSWSFSICISNSNIYTSSIDGKIQKFLIKEEQIGLMHNNLFFLRKQLTELNINNLNTEENLALNINCVIIHFSYNQGILTILTNNKILIYKNNYDEKDYINEIDLEEIEELEDRLNRDDFSFTLINKVSKKFEDPILIQNTKRNCIIVDDKKLLNFDFYGKLLRQWNFSSKINLIKLYKGLKGKEMIVLTLEEGDIMKIYLDNPFPIQLISHKIKIKKFDIDKSKEFIVIIDNNNNLYVYNLFTKVVVKDQLDVEDACFHNEIENFLCYISKGIYYINYENHNIQNSCNKGILVEFSKNNFFLIENQILNQIEIPINSFLYYCLKKKDFKKALEFGILGCSENDLKLLGFESIKGGFYDIAIQAFQKSQDYSLIDFSLNIKNMINSKDFDKDILNGEILAMEKNYSKALEVFNKIKNNKKGIEIFISLGKFNEAMSILKNQTNSNNILNPLMKNIIIKNAEKEKQKGNILKAYDLLKSCNEFDLATDLLIENGNHDKLIQLMRTLNKERDESILLKLFEYFKKIRNNSAAKETLLKIGDNKLLVEFNMEIEKWDEALEITKTNKNLRNIILIPYAEWLIKNNKFEEAQKYYKEAGREDLSKKIIEKLAKIYIQIQEFNKAGKFFNKLVIELIKDYNETNKDLIKENFEENLIKSKLLFAYKTIIDIDMGFDEKYTEEEIFYKSRYIFNFYKKINFEELNINIKKVLTILSKYSLDLKINGVAKIAIKMLQDLCLNRKEIEEVELMNMKIINNDYKDPEEHLYICYRCDNFMSLLNGERCKNCGMKIILSGLSFKQLKLIEFQLDDNRLTLEDLEDLLSKINLNNNKKNKEDDWKDENENRIKINGQEEMPFFKFLKKNYEINNDKFDTLIINKQIFKSLNVNEVMILDNSEINPNFPFIFYKKIEDDQEFVSCNETLYLYDVEEFDDFYIENNGFPYVN